MRFKKNLSAKINLINLLRELWQEHIFWTRAFIISAVSDMTDLECVTNRLLRNPADFANVLKLYYGDNNAKIFETLFTEHLTIACDLLNYIKESNVESIEKTKEKWYKNANEILEFLNKINPYMSIKKFQSLFYHHLKGVEDSINYRLNKQYGQDIITSDMMMTEAMKMADIMSYGMLDQFYNR